MGRHGRQSRSQGPEVSYCVCAIIPEESAIRAPCITRRRPWMAGLRPTPGAGHDGGRCLVWVLARHAATSWLAVSQHQKSELHPRTVVLGASAQWPNFAGLE